jgi:hypothetical protein
MAGAAPTVVVGLDVADLSEAQRRLEVLKLRRRVQTPTALRRLALALRRTSGYLTEGLLPDGRAKTRIPRAVDRDGCEPRNQLPIGPCGAYARIDSAWAVATDDSTAAEPVEGRV